MAGVILLASPSAILGCKYSYRYKDQQQISRLLAYFSASAGVAERPASSMRGSAVRGILGCGSMGFHFPFIILSCCWNTFI